MIDPNDATALLLSLKLATITTIILLAIGIPLAWRLRSASRNVKIIAESLIALPLVLPPTVLGYYLLLVFAPGGSWLGGLWYQVTQTTLSFSFSGLVIGSLFYSLPFVVQPILAAFDQVPQRYLDAAMVLGASKKKCLTKILLPLSYKSILMGAALGFAHTMGEFGVVLMIGGNIPGETQVVAIQLYDHVESMNYTNANKLALILLLLSFSILLTSYWTHYRNLCSTPNFK